MSDKALNVQAKAVANELEAILKLLGGTPDERWRAIEIITGLTRPAVATLVASQLEAMAQSLHGVRTTCTTMMKNAKELSAH